MGLLETITCWRVARRFPNYKPQRVTTHVVQAWLAQFPPADRSPLLRLLKAIRYYSEEETTRLLVQLNTSLLADLAADGVPAKNVIYVQVHDAGSSSPVMLNQLRDAARLERKGCSFLDGRDTKGLHDLTNKLGSGAIVYVDDFLASGNQFCEARDFASGFVVGNFAEFVLAPCICEEAMTQLNRRGLDQRTHYIHVKAERPLRPECAFFDTETRERLVRHCRAIHARFGLGYRELATMVAFSRNTPNTVPLILRGSLNQNPWLGVLPRTTDL